MAQSRMGDGFELTLQGLLRKRGEMARDVEAMREQLGVLLSGLDHIDAAIRIFNPAIDLEDMPERPVPPPNPAFRGEVQRFLLHALRTAGEPMTTHDLAAAVMEARRLKHGGPGAVQARIGTHRPCANQAAQDGSRRLGARRQGCAANVAG